MNERFTGSTTKGCFEEYKKTCGVGIQTSHGLHVYVVEEVYIKNKKQVDKYVERTGCVLNIVSQEYYDKIDAQRLRIELENMDKLSN